MVDYKMIAIADCLKHPKLGIVSHQPAWDEPISDLITVRDSDFILHHNILASECEYSSKEERNTYWKKINELKGG